MVFDGHSDIFTDVLQRRLQGETDVLRKHHLPRLRKGQIEGGCFVLWVDPPYTTDYAKRTEQLLWAIKEEMAECQESTLVHNTAEIQKAKEEGRFYILLGAEGLASIGDDTEKLDQLYDFGLRHAMLTWNEENMLGTGVQGTPGRGLTQAGKKMVRALEERKMIVDVSHLNETSFWDVMATASTPILASHSNARALSDAARNLTDDQLKEIAKTGGLVGLNSFNLFVSQSIPEQTIDRFVDHASYIAEKIGVEHMGFGFDFFEFLSTDSMKSYSDQDTSYTTGLEDCSKVPVLLEKMRNAGFTKEELEMISWKNWHGLIQKVLG